MNIKQTKSVLSLLSPRENKNPNTILYWRERIFYSILLGGVVLGIFVLIPSITSCLEDKLYVQIVVDLIVYSVVVFFLFDSKISFKIKTIIFLFFIYALAVSLILMGGTYVLGGYLYLVSFSIVASVWRGTKFAIITLAINILTITLIGFLSYNQIIIINGFDSYNINRWFTLITNLLIANGISAISVGLLLDGLERTINQTLKLKNQLGEEKIKLEAAKEKAEEADKLKTTFLGNMSHELKTPLNAIIGFSDLILKDKITDLEEIYSFQKIIAEGGDMLLGLINDILDISVIESGQLKIAKKKVYLKQIIDEIDHTFDEKLIAGLNKNIDFSIKENFDVSNFQIFTDPLRLKQVINNLIKNALKFTDEGKVIFSYDFTNNQKEILFKVQDTGIGIPEDKLEEIFNRFTKLNDSSKNTITGTGLGLAISKEIVDLLGGKIWVESTYGKGTTFFFTVQTNISEINTNTINKEDTSETSKIIS